MSRFIPSRPILRALDIVLLAFLALTLGMNTMHAWRVSAEATREAELRAAFDLRHYIELKSVVVDDAAEGDPIYLHVIRDLHQDFDGFYRVTIRNADGGAVVCSTGRVSIAYRTHDVNGDPTQLPEPLLLSYWAEGGDCTGDIRRGLLPGKYAIETCHGHNRPPGFDRPQEICWPSLPVFTVLPREAYP